MQYAKWILAASSALAAVACGQKGPLYLPDHNTAVITRPAESTQPAPQPGQETTPPQEPTQQPQTSPPSAPQEPANPPRQQQKDKKTDSPPIP